MLPWQAAGRVAWPELRRLVLSGLDAEGPPTLRPDQPVTAAPFADQHSVLKSTNTEIDFREM